MRLGDDQIAERTFRPKPGEFAGCRAGAVLKDDAKTDVGSCADINNLASGGGAAFDRLFHQDMFARSGQAPHGFDPGIGRGEDQRKIDRRIGGNRIDIVIHAHRMVQRRGGRSGK